MVLDTTRTIKTPIQGKYTAIKLFQQNKRRKQTEANGNGRPPEHWTTYGNGRPKHDANGRPPKVYIHSGNVGNAIPGSEKSAESVRS